MQRQARLINRSVSPGGGGGYIGADLLPLEAELGEWEEGVKEDR